MNSSETPTETKKELQLFQITVTENELFLLSTSLTAMNALIRQDTFIATTAALLVVSATTKEEHRALSDRLIQLISTIKNDPSSTL